MITVSDITNHIHSICPKSLCFDGDNVGHLIGKANSEVSRVLVSLDVDEYIVKEAIDKKADLIVSHHPLMFHPISKITDSDPQERAISLMIENGISLVSAHTNLDSVRGGLNDLLASKLGITDTAVIEPCGEFKGNTYGFGRVGDVSPGTKLSDMLSLCVSALKTSGLKYIGNPEKCIKRAAVNCGSGADAIDFCVENKVDLLITGDVKYSLARKAYEADLCVIDAGHYETEHIVVDLLGSIIKSKFSNLEVFPSEANIPVFNYFS